MLVLVGCGSGRDTASQARSPSASARTSASASPSPSVAAADGTRLGACADGSCEVRVGPSARIPVPRSMQVKSVRVRSVTATTVTIVGRDTGNSSGGSATGNVRASSNNGRFQIAMGVNSEASENGLDIAVLAIQNGHAVLRITPL